jgi:hypothetical protein
LPLAGGVPLPPVAGPKPAGIPLRSRPEPMKEYDLPTGTKKFQLKLLVDIGLTLLALRQLVTFA